MTDTTMQTAAETANTAPPATAATAAGEGAQPNLDTLLQEWEAGSKTPTVETTTAPAAQAEPPPIDPHLVLQAQRDLQDFKQAEINRKTNEAINEAVKAAKGDLPISDKLARGFLETLAQDDPRFLKAFTEREKNPAAYKAILGAAQAELRKEIEGLPDRTATANREAVAALVRGSSTAPARNDTPDFSKMTDRQIEAWTNQETAKFR